MDVRFFYQIGRTTTNRPWSRPSYHVVQSFLSNPIINGLFEKYNIILGGCFLYDKPTWDLDLFSIYDYGENTNWDQVETDFDTLNNTALNEYGLLLDLCMKRVVKRFATKNELEKFNEGKPFKDWSFNRDDSDFNVFIKFRGVKKIVNDKIEFNTIDGSLSNECIPLTDNHLIKIDKRNGKYPYKLISLIMQTKNDDSIITLPYKEFQSMSEQEFKDFLVPIETKE